MQIEEVKAQLIVRMDDCFANPLMIMRQKKVIADLRAASTASELAEAFCGYLYLMPRPDRVAKWGLDRLIDPAIWSQCGVLFNPGTITDDFPESSYCVVGSDKEQTLTLEADKEIIYLGNGRVEAYAGTAELLGESATAHVYDQAKAYLYNRSQGYAYDQAKLICCDQSRGQANDNAVVRGLDQSFVMAAKGTPTVFAQDQAQLFVLSGAPILHLTDSARGYLNLEYTPTRPIKVSLSGECLLFEKALDKGAIQVEMARTDTRLKHRKFLPEIDELQPTREFTGVWVRGDQVGLADMSTQHLVIPRLVCPTGVDNPTPLVEPMELGRLKTALLDLGCPGYKPELVAAIQEASDERGMCQLLAPHLPVLVGQGLDGAFLRSHFTEEALEESLIHAFDYPEACRYNGRSRGLHQFFGEQMVQAHRYNGEVIGYECTRVISDRGDQPVSIRQSANGLALGQGHLLAHEESKAIAIDAAILCAFDAAVVRYEGRSSGVVSVRANAVCYGQSSVQADGKAVLRLYDESRAEVTDQVGVLALGNNEVVADGHAVVGYVTHRKDVHPSIVVRSESVEVCPLTRGASLTRFAKLLDGVRDTSQRPIR